jgi:phosphatidylinositol 4-kinase type 2
MTKRFLGAIKIICGRTGDEDDIYDDSGEEDERVLFDATEDHDSGGQFYWTQLLQQSFREELEK